MSDKRITPEEDYLDSLLRSITGGGEEELDDNFIADDMDFDSEVGGGMSEEDFLSDFEKEFFGADIDSSSAASSEEKVNNDLVEVDMDELLNLPLMKEANNVLNNQRENTDSDIVPSNDEKVIDEPISMDIDDSFNETNFDFLNELENLNKTETVETELPMEETIAEPENEIGRAHV